MNSRKLQEKLNRQSGKRGIKEIKKFKRSSRSRVEDDGQQIADDRCYGWREGGGHIAWRLSPKWLKSRVGCKWSDVYSELCKEVTDKELLTDFVRNVETSVFLHEGNLCFVDGIFGLRVLNEVSEQFYVYHGILHRTQKIKKSERKIPASILITDKACYIRKDGSFYVIPDSAVQISIYQARSAATKWKDRFLRYDEGIFTLRKTFGVRMFTAGSCPIGNSVNVILTTSKMQLSKKKTKALLVEHPEAADLLNYDGPLPTRYSFF